MTVTTQDVRQYSTFLRTQLGELADLFPHLTRLLADGGPVPVERLAAAAGLSAAEVAAGLEGRPDIDWTDDGQIRGFPRTPHTFTDGTVVLYLTCASHALQMPVILGRSGVVESVCPATGRAIRVQVTPREVRQTDPAQAVVSKVRPAVKVRDVFTEICSLGSFCASPQAASGWLRQHPQGMVVPVADEFEIIRQAMVQLGWASEIS